MNTIVLKNALSLLILQGANYILPLVLIPFYIVTIGIDNYGTIAFAVATMLIFRTIVSFGFDLTATKQISRNRNNKSSINKIFTSVMMAKLLMGIFSLLILFIFILFIEKINENYIIFLFSFTLVVGEALFPFWFFQGIEKMKFITYIQVSYKALLVIVMFLFIKEPSDYLLIPLIEGIGYIIIGLFSLYYIKSKFKVIFIKPKLSLIMYQLKTGFHIFLSNIAVVFYTGFNIFILGLFTTSSTVGYYSIAEKIFFAMRGLIDPLNKALFPYLSNLYKKDKIRYYHIVKRILVSLITLLFIFFLIINIFSSDLIKLISGTFNDLSNDLLKILSFALIFSLGSYFTSLLVIKSKQKDLLKITLSTMFFNLILIFPLINYYGVYGIAYLFLTVQILHTLLQFKYNKEIFIREKI